MTPPERTRLICPLTSATRQALRADMLAARLAGADCIEVRLDSLAPPPRPADLADLLADPPLPLLVTVRPTRQGGHFDGPEPDRLALLEAAAELPDVLTVDCEDDVPADRRPAGPLVLSHHDFDRWPEDADQLWRTLRDQQPAVAKLAARAAGPEHALAALDLVRSADGAGIALAMGEPGLPSRLLAAKARAWGTFASLSDDKQSAPGQPTLADMRDLYRFESISPETQVFGVVGCPIAHSMSPAIHNAAFAAVGLDAVYLPLRVEPGFDPFRRFLDAALQRDWLDLRGLSVTIPHKEHALNYVGPDRCDELGVRIGAINTVGVGPDGTLRGWNTDYAAALDALCQAMGIARPALADRAVTILGAGGAARALVAALAHYRADVTVCNRTPTRAEALAGEFGCRSAPLDAAASTEAEIVINCTPLGMHPRVDGCALDRLPPGTRVVFETIYNPLRTRLLDLADRAGCTTVTGLEMFVGQAVAQFQHWTDRTAPADVMRQVVLDRLTPPSSSQN